MIDEHYFDVRQAQDRRMEYIQKKIAFHIHTYDRRMEYVWKNSKRKAFEQKIEEMKARHHMNMQPISLYQVKSVSS